MIYHQKEGAIEHVSGTETEADSSEEEQKRKKNSGHASNQLCCQKVMLPVLFSEKIDFNKI